MCLATEHRTHTQLTPHNSTNSCCDVRTVGEKHAENLLPGGWLEKLLVVVDILDISIYQKYEEENNKQLPVIYIV